MKTTIVFGVSCIILICTTSLRAQQADPIRGISNIWSTVREEGGRALTIAKIKAVYADRKDIPGRYIRVRFDGKTLQLAGFVPNKDIEAAAADLAIRIAKPETFQKFLAVESSMPTNLNYNTCLGEQSQDAILKAKVLTSLAGPAVHPQLKHADIVHIGVDHGHVSLFIIADAEPATFSLDPYIKPIAGVESVKLHVVKAY